MAYFQQREDLWKVGEKGREQYLREAYDKLKSISLYIAKIK